MSSSSELRRTPLFDWHAGHGGRMVDFAGWSMPVQYASIVGEHNATRSAVGLFDISHMGRLVVSGADAARFLDAMVTRRVDNMRPGQIRYALVCNADGGILDDVLVYRYAAGTTFFGDVDFGLVVNASNTAKIVDWLKDREIEFAARVTNHTAETAMIAVQGPQAMELAGPMIEADIASLRYYTGCETKCAGATVYVSRTGYTGEDGVEIIAAADRAAGIWEALAEKCAAVGGSAVGLGARDTLRLEAGMPLYGHELDESTNPLEADLNFAISFADRDFIGRDALVAAQQQGVGRTRIGLVLEGRRAAREGAAVLLTGDPIGHVTSGTFSPTFSRPIAMAYIGDRTARVGDQVVVDIRGSQTQATVVALPFYKRS